MVGVGKGINLFPAFGGQNADIILCSNFLVQNALADPGSRYADFINRIIFVYLNIIKHRVVAVFDSQTLCGFLFGVNHFNLACTSRLARESTNRAPISFKSEVVSNELWKLSPIATTQRSKFATPKDSTNISLVASPICASVTNVGINRQNVVALFAELLRHMSAETSKTDD